MQSNKIVITSNTKNRLTLNEIEKLVRHCFGERCKVANYKELTEGMFNAIYSLTFAESNAMGYQELILKVGVPNDKYVLTYEKDIMPAEIEAYRLLHTTNIPAPKILFSDFSYTQIDSPYFFMEKLNGMLWINGKDSLSFENRKHLEFCLGQEVAKMHAIKGDGFGYFSRKSVPMYPSWNSAFNAMVMTALQDAVTANITLPVEEITSALSSSKDVLDEICAPSLVNFDITGKNILLIKNGNAYIIEGMIDHERAFFGDPYADFLSIENIVGTIEQAYDFIDGYENQSGKPLTFTKYDKTRLQLYRLYMGIIQCAEVYRFDNPAIREALSSYAKNKINTSLNELAT